MSKNSRTCLLLEISQPEAAKKPECQTLYEEGKHLARSIEEDVSSYTLRPTYNQKQQRTIKRLSNEKTYRTISKPQRPRNRRISRQTRRSYGLKGVWD